MPPQSALLPSLVYRPPLQRSNSRIGGFFAGAATAGSNHTVHHVDSPDARPRIALIFQARSWTGDPEVLEPDRCVEWRWWKPQDLPAEVVPYTRMAIDGILRGRPYSEQGWRER